MTEILSQIQWSDNILPVIVDDNDYFKIADDLIHNTMSPNTSRAYRGDIYYFFSWMKAAGLQLETPSPFPVQEDTIIAFIIQHIVPGKLPENVDNILYKENIKLKKGTHSFATVDRRIESIGRLHKINELPSPADTLKVRRLMKALRKEYGTRNFKKAITKDILDKMLSTCDESLIGIRDKAFLLFGWASGGRRRSEIADAKLENLVETLDGDYIYRMEKSKNDPEGKGHNLPVKGKAARALREWISCLSQKEGPIFRSIGKGENLKDNPLTGVDINRIVKKRLSLCGYDDKKFGAHSIRSGFVTEGGKRGMPLGDIMAMTTHRSIDTVMSYYQSGSILNNSAAHLAD